MGVSIWTVKVLECNPVHAMVSILANGGHCGTLIVRGDDLISLKWRLGDDGRWAESGPYLRAVCVDAAGRPGQAEAYMKSVGLVFDNLDDPMQKLAFELYALLVEDATKAEAALDRVRSYDTGGK